MSETARRSRLSRTGIVVLVAVLVVVLVAVGEFVIRSKIRDCIGRQFSTVSSDVSVGLSPKPVLLQLLEGEISYVTVEAKQSDTAPVKGLSIKGRVDGVKINNGATRSSSATLTWTTRGVLETLRQQTYGQYITGVTTSSDSTLRIDLAGGLASARIKAEVVDKTLKFETLDSEFLGIGIPNTIVDNILSTLNTQLSSSKLPFGLKAQSIQVDSTGMTIGFEGKDWNPPAEQDNANATGTNIPAQNTSLTNC